MFLSRAKQRGHRTSIVRPAAACRLLDLGFGSVSPEESADHASDHTKDQTDEESVRPGTQANNNRFGSRALFVLTSADAGRTTDRADDGKHDEADECGPTEPKAWR
jgi:hypothetical protein